MKLLLVDDTCNIYYCIIMHRMSSLMDRYLYIVCFSLSEEVKQAYLQLALQHTSHKSSKVGFPLMNIWIMNLQYAVKVRRHTP